MNKRRKKEIISNSNIRKIQKKIYSHLNLNNENVFSFIKGLTYNLIHTLFILTLLFIGLFNVYLLQLIIILIIITLDACSVVILHGCPLTLLEKKYLKYDKYNDFCCYMDDLNILYTCDHEYENTLEFITIGWCIIVFKIISIILLKTFHIKLENKIYV
jgi:hypothetical protein